MSVPSVTYSHFQSVSVIFDHFQSLWLNQKRGNVLTIRRWGKQHLSHLRRWQAQPLYRTQLWHRTLATHDVPWTLVTGKSLSTSVHSTDHKVHTRHSLCLKEDNVPIINSLSAGKRRFVWDLPPQYPAQDVPFFTQISGRNLLPELCGEIHPGTAPLQALPCAPFCSTEQSTFRGGENALRIF